MAYWVGQLDLAAGKMLRKLVDVYPGTMGRDELADATGYSPASGHVDNMIGALRTRELITGGRSELRASEDLFE